jgi:hypothetical protein
MTTLAVPVPGEGASRSATPGGQPGPSPGTPVLAQVEGQLSDYENRARNARVGHLALRLVALVFGATVTVLAAADVSPLVTASFAAAVVVSEGIQQLLQLHTHWLSYRDAIELLRQESFRYVNRLEPYDDDDTARDKRLATVLSQVITSEHKAWAIAMRASRSTSGTSS